MTACKESIQDMLSGYLIQHLFLPSTADASLGERKTGGMRGESFVHQTYGEPESCLEILRKLPAPRRLRVLGAIEMRRQTHHQQHRLPL